jgi:hypothetical protein
MKNSRRLTLRRETLTALTNDELRLAGGAIGGPPSLQPGCSYEDVRDWANDVLLEVTLHQHCSWSCI